MNKKPTLATRNLFGKDHTKQFEDVRPSKNNTEAGQIKGNNKYIAFPWQSAGGGALSILENDSFCKLSANHSKIQGHTGPIMDFSFYPFDDNFIATGSEDCTLRLWQIPEDFCKSSKDLMTPVAELHGHSNKIVFT